MKKINSLLVVVFIALIIATFFAKSNVGKEVKQVINSELGVINIANDDINHNAAVAILTGMTEQSAKTVVLEPVMVTSKRIVTKDPPSTRKCLKSPKKCQIEAIANDPPPLPSIYLLPIKSLPGFIPVARVANVIRLQSV